MSDEADPLYRPLGGLRGWAAAVFDEKAWTGGVERLALAAAYQSAGLDGLYAIDDDLVRARLLGEATLGSIDAAAHPHARANYDALQVARQVDVSEESIRRIHALACRTHAVRVDHGLQDHVLAAGDYKHHPNHILDPAGQYPCRGGLRIVPGVTQRPRTWPPRPGASAKSSTGRMTGIDSRLSVSDHQATVRVDAMEGGMAEHWSDDRKALVWHKSAEESVETARRGRAGLVQVDSASGTNLAPTNA